MINDIILVVAICSVIAFFLFFVFPPLYFLWERYVAWLDERIGRLHGRGGK